MKHYILLVICQALLLSGCATTGSNIQKLGQTVVEAGAGTMVTGGAFGMPGVIAGGVVGLPIYGLGSVIYGVGSAMGGNVDKNFWQQ